MTRKSISIAPYGVLEIVITKLADGYMSLHPILVGPNLVCLSRLLCLITRLSTLIMSDFPKRRPPVNVQAPKKILCMWCCIGPWEVGSSHKRGGQRTDTTEEIRTRLNSKAKEEVVEESSCIHY